VTEAAEQVGQSVGNRAALVVVATEEGKRVAKRAAQAAQAVQGASVGQGAREAERAAQVVVKEGLVEVATERGKWVVEPAVKAVKAAQVSVGTVERTAAHVEVGTEAAH